MRCTKIALTPAQLQVVADALGICLTKGQGDAQELREALGVVVAALHFEPACCRDTADVPTPE